MLQTILSRVVSRGGSMLRSFDCRLPGWPAPRSRLILVGTS